MAKPKLLFTPSGENQCLGDITVFREAAEKALLQYYLDPDPNEYVQRFPFYSHDEIWAELDRHREEVDMLSSLALLAAIEAAFQLDYHKRVHGKYKDALTKELTKLFNRKRERVKFIDELIKSWYHHGGLNHQIQSEMHKAFEYRNWLAHGRFKVFLAKARYDFQGILNLAHLISKELPSLPL